MVEKVKYINIVSNVSGISQIYVRQEIVHILIAFLVLVQYFVVLNKYFVVPKAFLFFYIWIFNYMHPHKRIKALRCTHAIVNGLCIVNDIHQVVVAENVLLYVLFVIHHQIAQSIKCMFVNLLSQHGNVVCDV